MSGFHPSTPLRQYLAKAADKAAEKSMIVKVPRCVSPQSTGPSLYARPWTPKPSYRT